MKNKDLKIQFQNLHFWSDFQDCSNISSQIMVPTKAIETNYKLVSQPTQTKLWLKQQVALHCHCSTPAGMWKAYSSPWAASCEH